MGLLRERLNLQKRDNNQTTPLCTQNSEETTHRRLNRIRGFYKTVNYIRIPLWFLSTYVCMCAYNLNARTYVAVGIVCERSLSTYSSGSLWPRMLYINNKNMVIAFNRGGVSGGLFTMRNRWKIENPWSYTYILMCCKDRFFFFTKTD